MAGDPREGWVALRDIPDPPYPPFVIPDVLHDVCTVMYGRPEAGKSFAALSLAASLTTGEPWLGKHEIRETRTVAFLALDPGQVAQTKGRAAKGFRCLDKMLLSTRRPSPESWPADAGRLRDLGVDFLIIDNLSRLLPVGASARDDAQAEMTLRNINAFLECEIAVLLLHHARKPGEDGNPKTTPMGATAIESWARHLIRVDAVTDKAGKVSRKIVSYGNDMTSDVLTVPFAIDEEAGEVLPVRDWQLNAERIRKIRDGEPWDSQTAIASALMIDKGTVSRLLRKEKLQLEDGRLAALRS